MQRLKQGEAAEARRPPATSCCSERRRPPPADDVLDRVRHPRRGRRRRDAPPGQVLPPGARRPDRRLRLARPRHHDPPRGLPERAARCARTPSASRRSSWDGENETAFKVELHVDAWDRHRLLEDLSRTFAEAGINIVEARCIVVAPDGPQPLRVEVGDTQALKARSAACATSTRSSTPTASRPAPRAAADLVAPGVPVGQGPCTRTVASRRPRRASTISRSGGCSHDVLGAPCRAVALENEALYGLAVRARHSGLRPVRRAAGGGPRRRSRCSRPVSPAGSRVRRPGCRCAPRLGGDARTRHHRAMHRRWGGPLVQHLRGDPAQNYAQRSTRCSTGSTAPRRPQRPRLHAELRDRRGLERVAVDLHGDRGARRRGAS